LSARALREQEEREGKLKLWDALVSNASGFQFLGAHVEWGSPIIKLKMIIPDVGIFNPLIM
jgi:hypothetical protein